MAGPFTRLRRESKADIAVDGNLSAAAQDAITEKHTQGSDTTLGTNKLVVEGDTGNVGIGTTVFGTSAAKVLGMGNCTKTTSFPADMFQMGPFDQAAGNACPHFWTELGKEIKLYQQAHIVDADGTLADITTKFNTLLTYMENLGFNATA